VRTLCAAALGVATCAAIAGCSSSASDSPLRAARVEPVVAAVDGALPDVTVAVKHGVPHGTEASMVDGHLVRTADEAGSWYVTTVRDPEHGGYIAAVERRSLNDLDFDSDAEVHPHAMLTLVLRDGRPADLVLSVEGGQFACVGKGRDNSCALNVAVDGAAARAVRFAVPRHWEPSYLHLAGGADSHRLLASIARAKRLVIQSTFKDEAPAELQFALNGLSPAIARVLKHSVAAVPTLAAATPAG
jgi:hypothetical protein